MAEEKVQIKISSRRCFIHPDREAAARCPDCERYYCRECVTEHEGRVLCSSCLKKVRRQPLARRFRLATIGRLVQCFVSFVILWTIFYYLGHGLLNISSVFHEGTVWEEQAD
jgi:hypothetical protein